MAKLANSKYENDPGESAELKARIEELEKEVKDLTEDARFLWALEAAGVDNWEGYEHAQELMDEG